MEKGWDELLLRSVIVYKRVKKCTRGTAQGELGRLCEWPTRHKCIEVGEDAWVAETYANDMRPSLSASPVTFWGSQQKMLQMATGCNCEWVAKHSDYHHTTAEVLG